MHFIFNTDRIVSFCNVSTRFLVILCLPEYDMSVTCTWLLRDVVWIFTAVDVGDVLFLNCGEIKRKSKKLPRWFYVYQSMPCELLWVWILWRWVISFLICDRIKPKCNNFPGDFISSRIRYAFVSITYLPMECEVCRYKWYVDISVLLAIAWKCGFNALNQHWVSSVIIDVMLYSGDSYASGIALGQCWWRWPSTVYYFLPTVSRNNIKWSWSAPCNVGPLQGHCLRYRANIKPA